MRPFVKLVNKARGITFSNYLTANARCGRKPSAVISWGATFEYEALGIRRSERVRTWAGYLNGRLPRARLRAALCKRFTVLLLVLANPLWTVLPILGLNGVPPTQGDQRRINRLARSIRINEAPLTEQTFTAFQRLVALANWQSLSLMLVILASRCSQCETIRVWLSQRFAVTFLLICLDRELAVAERFLFQIVDHLVRRGVLVPILAWPKNLEEFQHRLTNLRALTNKLHCVRRVSEDHACKLLKALFSNGDATCPYRNDLDVCTGRTFLDVDVPELAPLFERCRKQARWRGHVTYHFHGLKLDPKVMQGWEQLAAKESELARARGS